MLKERSNQRWLARQVGELCLHPIGEFIFRVSRSVLQIPYKLPAAHLGSLLPRCLSWLSSRLNLPQ